MIPTANSDIVSDLPDTHDVPLDADVIIDGVEYARIMREIAIEDGESVTPVAAFNSSI